MPEFFLFLLKVNVALTLFCLAYYLILRQLTFYTLNRFFLIGGIVFSSLYPFVDLKVIFGSNGELVQPITAALPVIYLNLAENAGFDYWFVAKLVFWIGVFVLSCRMIQRFYALYQVHRQSTPGSIKNYQVRFLKGDQNTFSFWRSIYLNPELQEPKALEAILEHEQVHVKQWHTLDIILAELTTIGYWFNPGVWYMKKAIQENVEFITDQVILQKGMDRKAYQYSMIETLTNGNSTALINHFNITGLKKRIIMMNSKRSSSFQLIRYVFLLPVLLILTSAFTFYKGDELRNSTETLLNKVSVATGIVNEQQQSAALQSVSELNQNPDQEKPVKATKKQQGLTKQPSPQKQETTRTTKTSKSGAVKVTTVIVQQSDTVKQNVQTGKVFTSNSTADNIAFLRGVKVKQNGTDDSTKRRSTLRVTGFRGNQNGAEGPLMREKSLRLRGVRVKQNSADGSTTIIQGDSLSIKTSGHASKYFLNEVESPSSVLGSLNPDEISAIEVYKNNSGPKKDGIWIYTKDFKKLK